MASNFPDTIEINSDEEVRKKPRPALSRSQSADTSEYYDIMIVGRAGKGKSSVADKLMTFNPRKTDTGMSTQGVEPIIDESGEIQLKNLRARILSVKSQDYENASKRLKNIDFCWETGESIDTQRNSPELKEIYQPSKHCELLINTNSKIRVLDAPGFFSEDLLDDTENTEESNLATVRNIIRIQELEHLKFKRILFFLSGNAQVRGDRVMREEIQCLTKFFGDTIFRRMVLVATIPPHLSESGEYSRDKKFPNKDLENCKQNFQEVLRREFGQRNMTQKPQHPPIIFIAMTDSCEEILHNIKSAKVVDDEGFLVFNSSTCSDCGIEISTCETVCEYRRPGEKPWTNKIEYKKTFCHPKIIPVRTFKSVIIGLFKIFLFKWKFTEEQCIECKKRPGTTGCCRVETDFNYRNERITVKHSAFK